MEFFAVLIGLAALGLPSLLVHAALSSFRRELADSEARLTRAIANLRAELLRAPAERASTASPAPSVSLPAPPPARAEQPAAVAPPTVTATTPAAPPPTPVAPPTPAPAPVPQPTATPLYPSPVASVPPAAPEATAAPATTPAPAVKPALRPLPPSKPSVTLEAWVGDNLSKVGIVILVLGIGFFVKYAIDQNWIGPLGRALIGFVTGLGLIALGHRLRRDYHAFSSVLVGGGLAALYLTVGIAFHLYELFGQAQAFGAMVAITTGAVWLALLYDRRELAILALLGGLGTPFFVSTGSGDYRILFSYLLILNGGMAYLARSRRWGELNIIAQGITSLILLSWVSFGEVDALSLVGGLGFGLAFFALYIGMNLAYALHHRTAVVGREFLLLLLNAVVALGFGLVMLQRLELDDWRALYVFGLGLIHLGLVMLLRRRVALEPTLDELLRGIALCLVVLAVPLQTRGPALPVAWVGLAVVVMQLWRRSPRVLYQIGVEGLLVLSLISTFAVVGVHYAEAPTAAWFSGMLVAGLLVVGGYQWFRRTLVAVAHAQWRGSMLQSSDLRALLAVAVPVLCYLVPWVELNRLVVGQGLPYSVQVLLLGLYHALALNLLVRSQAHLEARYRTLLTSGAALALVLVLGAWVIGQLGALALMAATGAAGGLWFWLHLLVYPAALYLLTGVYLEGRRQGGEVAAPITWLTVAAALLLTSQWLEVLALASFGSDAAWDVRADVRKAGLTVLWGVMGFTLIVVGLLSKSKQLRIVALAVLGLAVAKLFVFDLRGANEAGRIVAFTLLGVLLLSVSFLYQKLKRLLLTDDEGPDASGQ